jgi:hypothetical protein
MPPSRSRSGGSSLSTSVINASAASRGSPQAEAAEYYPWPDIRYLPIRDAEPSRWALVWRSAAETPLVRAFAEAAADARPCARPVSGGLGPRGGVHPA